tara:strand:+ start:50 stop:559 length:510 start_codon:yes stop_codon:yes gene_type:complete
MAYSVQAFADDATDTFTDERYPLGSIRFETESEVETGDASLVGPRVMVFVKAGIALPANELVEKNAVSTSYVGKPSAAGVGTHPFSLLGVAVVTIPLNSYGWIVKQGECAVKSAGVAAGNIVGTSGATAGTVIPVVANASAITDTRGEAVGIALTATTGGLSDVYINIP